MAWPSTGALHGDSSTNAWNGPVVLSTAAIINVDSGGQLDHRRCHQRQQPA